MQLLITGAAGFLGSVLSNEFVRHGHAVRALDNLSTGNPENLSQDVELIVGDVNDRKKLWSLLKGVDCVFHLAARVLVPESILYPREYNDVNVGGTVTLMEAMRDVGVKRVVFISSGAIYGIQEQQPLREEVKPNPHSPYAVSKLAAEYYVRTIGSLWGIETVCLRVFNAYGPGQYLPVAHPPVIPNFLKQASKNGTLIIHGEGTQTRDYVYIDDVVSAMVSAANAPDIDRSVINIGSGVETNIRQLARMVIEITGGKPELVFNPRHDGGVDRTCADLSLALNKLGYSPKVPLAMGMQKTFELDPRFHPD